MALTPDKEAELDAFLSEEPVESAPAESVAPAAEEDEVEVEIPDELPEGDMFKRDYVEKLRRESAGYRERAKKYQSAFDGYEEDAVAEWLRLAQNLRADPKATAAEFQKLAEEIRAVYPEEEVPAIEEVFSDGEQPLTIADLQRLLDEREQEQDMKVRVAAIETEATGLGYKLGSDEYDELLWTATRLDSGSVKEAHDKLKARDQAVIDRYVADMKGSGGYKVPVGGAPASQEQKLDSFEAANEALASWLDSQ